MTPDDGMAEVWAGECRAETAEQADAEWCCVVAQGRIIEKITDGTRGAYAVWVHLVEHPALPAGQVFAIFSNREFSRMYQCSPGAARAAILHHGAFNLV